MQPPDSVSTAGLGVYALGKSFGRISVLQAIDFAVRPGAFVCLLGPSGCGKTTLLRCIAGLERPDRGRIVIGDRTVVDTERRIFVPPERRRLGMVFQHYALWPHMTVEQNIVYPLRKQGVPPTERERMLRQVMQVVGLPTLRDRRPSQLSGGQQQRVALARALIHEPPVLLLDEPLSNLDAALRGQLRRELRQLHERLGTTTVLVTHDQEEAAVLADIVAVMDHGEIIQIGATTTVFDYPATRFVAGFVGYDTFLAGTLIATENRRAIVSLRCGHKVVVAEAPQCPDIGASVIVAARSETLLLHPTVPAQCNDAIAGEIRHVARVGRRFEYEIGLGDQSVFVRRDDRDGNSEFQPGALVVLGFPPTRCVLVPADDGSPR